MSLNIGIRVAVARKTNEVKFCREKKKKYFVFFGVILKIKTRTFSIDIQFKKSK